LENACGNALAHKLCTAGLAVAQPCGATVTYDRTVVAEYFVDLVVEDAVLVELKSVKALYEACNASTISRQPTGSFARRATPQRHAWKIRCMVVRSGRSASISVLLLESA